MTVRHELEITFGDADPAGIAYYPRILDFCHRAFETFVATTIGEPYSRSFMQHDLGFPTVSLQAEFKAPMRFGDPIAVDVSVAAFSARSVTFVYRFTRTSDGTLCAVVRNVAVAVNRQTFKPMPIPERYVAAFRAHPER